jgi:dolichol-phosphate mannosyltransferase
MLQKAREADLVLGSRYVENGGTVNWRLGRKILSRGGSLYARTCCSARSNHFRGMRHTSSTYSSTFETVGRSDV